MQPRRSAPKSRRGCKTCKIRRVKCDETKPICQRCSNTGRKCDGYESSSSRESSVSTDVASAIRLLSPAFSPSLDPQARRSLDFFCNHTIPSLTGFSGSSVWKLAIQAAADQAPVREAVVALGAEYEQKSLQEPNGTGSTSFGWVPISNSFPAQQYAVALSSFREYMETNSRPDLNVVLLCALLHISLEVVRDNHANASAHLENSINVLKGALDVCDPIQSVQGDLGGGQVEDSLVEAFRRFDIHASSYQGTRAPALAEYGFQEAPSPRFQSLKTARAELDWLTLRVYTFMKTKGNHYRYNSDEPMPVDIIAEASQLAVELQEWRVKFNKFLDRPTTKLPRAEQTVAYILTVNCLMQFVEMSAVIHMETTFFDQFDREFDEIVSLAAMVLRAKASSSSMTLDIMTGIGIINPLSYTARNCREPWIRHRALELLRNIKFQEGVWNAATQASISEVVIRRENGDQDGYSTSRPPEWARVHSVGTEIDPVRRTTQVFMSMKPNGLDGPWDEVIGRASW